MEKADVGTNTYPAFIVESLSVNFACCEFNQVTVPAFDHDIGLALATQDGLGWLTAADDSLVLHVGIPEGGSKGASRSRDFAIDGLGTRVGRVNSAGWLDNKEVDALKRSNETLARRETGRWVGEQLCREGKDSTRFETWAVEILLSIERLAGLGLHSLVGFVRSRHGGGGGLC